MSPPPRTWAMAHTKPRSSNESRLEPKDASMEAPYAPYLQHLWVRSLATKHLDCAGGLSAHFPGPNGCCRASNKYTRSCPHIQKRSTKAAQSDD